MTYNLPLEIYPKAPPTEDVIGILLQRLNANIERALEKAAKAREEAESREHDSIEASYNETIIEEQLTEEEVLENNIGKDPLNYNDF